MSTLSENDIKIFTKLVSNINQMTDFQKGYLLCYAENMVNENANSENANSELYKQKRKPGRLLNDETKSKPPDKKPEKVS